MLYKILLSLGLLPVLLSGAGRPDRHADPAQGFALVELYTSEGCSSCPPADELVAALPKSYPSGVYLLSFHVDYWDRLGWKDPFSNADYTRRQKEYNTALSPMPSIFTPQVIINGKMELVGSDEPRIRAAIDSELAHTVNPVFDASAHSADNNTVTVDYTLSGKGAGEFRAALVQTQASTAVKNGENAGKQLHHAYIVRDLKSSGKRSGSLKLSLPAGLTPSDCRIVVFLQDKENLHIGGAHMLDIH
jgi:hypothetical protein